MTDTDSYLLKCTLEHLEDGESATEAQAKCELHIEPNMSDFKKSKNEIKSNQGE